MIAVNGGLRSIEAWTDNGSSSSSTRSSSAMPADAMQCINTCGLALC
jgi:hypothetical protein